MKVRGDGYHVVSLTLDDFISHARVEIAFDLFIIQTWDGNTVLDPAHPLSVIGPDIWSLEEQTTGNVLIETTFSTSYLRQAYPGWYPDGSYPAYTGASEANTLGFIRKEGRGSRDAVYPMLFTLDHTGDKVVFVFQALGLQGLADESWGLETCRVTLLGEEMEPDFQAGQAMPDPVEETLPLPAPPPEAAPASVRCCCRSFFAKVVEAPIVRGVHQFHRGAVGGQPGGQVRVGVKLDDKIHNVSTQRLLSNH